MTTAASTIQSTPQSPTIEQSYQQMVKDGVIKEDGAHQADAEGEALKGQAQEEKLILGKFKSQEELEKAYTELQTKLGKPKEEAPPKGDEPTAEAVAKAEADIAKAGLDVGAFEAEYAEKGELSADSYEKLEKAGISKTMVDAYIQGQAAQVALYENSVTDLAGGTESYEALLKWGSENLSDDEITQFDEAVNSFDLKKASFAVKNLQARMASTEGTPPASQVDGKGRAAAAGYESPAQMEADMNSPRYNTDSAFRAEVYRKLAATKAF